MMNVTLTFACKSWDQVERLIHDALMLESANGPEGMCAQLMHVEVER